MEIFHRHFESIDSTNTWAKRNAQLLPRDKLTVVTADTQSEGRGRFKRPWVSPPKQNIYASFCLFLEKHRHDIGNIPQVLAVSTAKMLEQLNFTPTLKWPNDVLLSGKKVAGILTETTPLSDMLCVIAGIGLNVNMPAALLQQIGQPATSLLDDSGRTFNVEDLLETLQKQFLVDLEVFLDEGFYPFLSDYRRYMQRAAGGTTRFNDNKTIWEGTIQAINDDGSLSLRLASGAIKTFLSGEIVL